MKKSQMLTTRQKVFVEEYLKTGNAVKAYAISHNKTESKAVAGWAYSFLNSPKVQAQLQRVETKALAKVEAVASRYCITKERIAEELAKIAFADMRNVIEWDQDGVRVKNSCEISDAAAGAISEVSETSGNKASKALVKIKSYDKSAALIALGKELGMFKDRVDHRVGVVAKFIIEE